MARTLFACFESGDDAKARSLCAPDLRAIQNGAPPMDLDALLAFSGAVRRAVPDFRYENIVCRATPDGFTEEHDVCGSLPDGGEFRIAACVVGDVRDGLIVALREYLDSAAAAGLIGALSRR